MFQSHKSGFWENILILKHHENNELYKKGHSLSDWSVGSLLQQTEMDLTHFEEENKNLLAIFFLPLFDGNFPFLWCHLIIKANENVYIKAKKSNLMKDGSNPFCKWALHIYILHILMETCL